MKNNFLLKLSLMLLAVSMPCMIMAQAKTFSERELKLPCKKGACFTLRHNAKVDNIEKVKALNVGWNYSWGAGLADSQPATIEFVPMTWGGKSVSNINNTIVSKVKSGVYKRLLAFNEPDGKKQANMTVEQAIEAWPMLESLGIPLGSPAVVDAENGEWIDRFMREADKRGYRVDYLCVHNYGGGNAKALEKKLTNIHNKYKRPLLITEFAVADWKAKTPEENRHSVASVLNFMKEILPWLEKTDFIYGYAWFSFGQNSAAGCTSALFDKNGEITELGKYYASFKSNH